MTRQKPRPSAYRWLWDEIARRFGEEARDELYQGYCEQSRIYQHEKWHTPESPPTSKQQRGRPRKKTTKDEGR